MTPEIYEQLVQVLRREALPLSRLHALAADAGSSWSVEQLHLMLACMQGIEIAVNDADEPLVELGQRSPEEQLMDAIAEVVRSMGRPVAAAQVVQMLHGRFTTSVEQIKKLARESSALDVVGPGLIQLR